MKLGDYVRIKKTAQTGFAKANINELGIIIEINGHRSGQYAILDIDVSKKGTYLKDLELVDLSIFNELGD